MPAVTDVDRNLSKGGFEDGMARVSLQVVGAFIEVTNTWNVVLQTRELVLQKMMPFSKIMIAKGIRLDDWRMCR